VLRGRPRWWRPGTAVARAHGRRCLRRRRAGSTWSCSPSECSVLRRVSTPIPRRRPRSCGWIFLGAGSCCAAQRARAARPGRRLADRASPPSPSSARVPVRRSTAPPRPGSTHWRQGLADAVHGSGVRMLVVRPGFVTTRMTAGLDPAPFATSAEAVAAAAVAALPGKGAHDLGARGPALRVRRASPPAEADLPAACRYEAERARRRRRTGRRAGRDRADRRSGVAVVAILALLVLAVCGVSLLVDRRRGRRSRRSSRSPSLRPPRPPSRRSPRPPSRRSG